MGSQMTDCVCMHPPFDYRDFSSVSVGTDETNGRFADVTIDACNKCQSKWLRYFVEYAGFSQSGRWYRGQVSDEVARTVTPESAVAVLEKLGSYFYGGSYFRSTGARGSGRLFVDL
jgi:hypothetical protein